MKFVKSKIQYTLAQDDLLGNPLGKPAYNVAKNESFANQLNSSGVGNLIDFDFIDNKKPIKNNQTSVIDVDFY